LLDLSVANALAEPARKRDISSWKQGDISPLNTRQKKRYYRYKSAVTEYFTTNTPLKTIAKRHRLSTDFVLYLAKQSLQQHEDGTCYGYRALLPEAETLSHPSMTLTQITPASGKTSATPPSPVGARFIAPSEQECRLEGAINRAPMEGERPATISPIETEITILTGSEVAVLAGSEVVAVTIYPLSKPTKRARRGKSAQKHRRRVRYKLEQSKSKRSFLLLNLAIAATLLLSIVTPLCLGLVAYSVYNDVHGLALDGFNHLLAINTLLSLSKNDPMAALEAGKLHQVQEEFRKAEADFVQLQQLVNRADVQSAVAQFSPGYADQLLMAKHLVQVALDVSHIGQEMCGVALIAANIIHGSPLANGSAKPLITPADVTTIEGAVEHALYYIDDIQAQMSQVQLQDLPISGKQKGQLEKAMEQLPRVHDLITQYKGLIGPAAWLLGVGYPRRFLVQTMDSAELRPSGGFTGQYAVLQVQDGRVGPLSLRDVALIDYAGNDVAFGRSAPPQYSSWMNFGDWGLRDSNLSGDYPTTAQMGMQVFEEEGGAHVDGDISFTPAFIAHILDVTGPIHVTQFGETITSKNLEDKLHYYQQDFGAIARQEQITNTNTHQTRKAFTSLLGKLLLDRVRHLSTKQLLNVIKGAMRDLQSRDLEIYLTNPVAEQWLVDHGYSGSIDPFTKQDGFAVVQANISVSKASQYIHTTEHDDIILDAQGGATHNLTITLDYHPTGPIYGFDTYADYIRVYAPATSQFLSGDGFDTGQCLTGGNSTSGTGGIGSNASTITTITAGSGNGGKGSKTSGCGSTGTFSSARYCPDGNYNLGDRYFGVPWKADSLGPPTAQTSDLPGRAMWGGLTETPKNCTSYIRLSWYVPHVGKNKAGQSPYTLLVQKQGGYIPTVEITIDVSALNIKGLKPFGAGSSDLVADKMFALQVETPPPSTTGAFTVRRVKGF
jgi:uncharacterized protein DUF4012